MGNARQAPPQLVVAQSGLAGRARTDSPVPKPEGWRRRFNRRCDEWPGTPWLIILLALASLPLALRTPGVIGGLAKFFAVSACFLSLADGFMRLGQLSNRWTKLQLVGVWSTALSIMGFVAATSLPCWTSSHGFLRSSFSVPSLPAAAIARASRVSHGLSARHGLPLGCW